MDRLKAETASSAATRTGKNHAVLPLLPSLPVLLPLLSLLPLLVVVVLVRACMGSAALPLRSVSWAYAAPLCSV